MERQEEIRELKQKIHQMQAEVKRLKKKETRAERKKREHALIVMSTTILSMCSEEEKNKIINSSDADISNWVFAKIEIGRSKPALQETIEAPSPDNTFNFVPQMPKNKVPNKTPSGKKIFQYDTNLKVVASYLSASEASAATGIFATSINKVCRGVGITAGGFFWSRGKRPLTKFPEKWLARVAELNDDN